MEGEVPVVGSTAEVKCENGASLTVRRLRKTERSAFQRAAGFPERPDVSRLQELMFRAAVTGASGLKDFDGKPVEYRRVREQGLGEISHADVYDFTGDEDTDTVLKFALSGQIDGAQRGN